MAPTWPPKPFQNKTQVGPKIHQKRDQDADQFFASFLIGLGTLFGRFCFEVGRPRDQKVLENLKIFSIFAISANLPTRGPMINFLVNLAPKLENKTHPKSTQEASKIDQKGHRKEDASWPRIWTPLGTILEDFEANLGGKLVPSWDQNRKNEGPKTMSKK